MSVLVKGMEMPINCMACKIKQRCFDCWLCPICKTGDKRPPFVDDYEGRRHPNCPLVEIPSKHGEKHENLIDRDKLETYDSKKYDTTAVEQLVQDEYNLASQQHGKYFNSPHEAYAVILEKMEEAERDFGLVYFHLRDYWRDITGDNISSYNIYQIKRNAIDAACGCIQVAAKAHKAFLEAKKEAKE